MVKRIIESCGKTPVIRVGIEILVNERNLDWFIGRTPHILLIDNIEIVTALLNRYAYLFEDNED